MIKLESISDYLPKIMELLSFNVLMGLGIAVMAIAIIRSGRSYKNLKDKNARQRRRCDAVYGDKTTHTHAVLH